jgi:hypothetical protein
MPEAAGAAKVQRATECDAVGAAKRYIALLDPGTSFIDQQFRHPLVCEQVDRIDIYDLPSADLGRYRGLIVPNHVDQEFLHREHARIRAFLDDGRVLVFNGHLFREWLPGARPFVPKGLDGSRLVPRGIHGSDDYNVRIVTPHPIFEGVRPEDLTFRRGVRGFFARGHHPPPDGAEILLTLESGEPIIHVDRRSTRGTILVHSGNDLLGYAGDATTASRVAPQLLRWMREVSRAPGETGEPA